MNVENNKSELIVSNNEKETNIVNNLEIQKEKTTNTSKVINENKACNRYVIKKWYYIPFFELFM